jgi:hypothetical protein
LIKFIYSKNEEDIKIVRHKINKLYSSNRSDENEITKLFLLHYKKKYTGFLDGECFYTESLDGEFFDEEEAFYRRTNKLSPASGREDKC